MKPLRIVTLLIIALLFQGCYHRPNCKDYSYAAYHRAQRWGYPVRYGIGHTADSKRRHRWTEYFKDRWLVWDDAQKYVGKTFHTAEELGYTVYWYAKENGD